MDYERKLRHPENIPFTYETKDYSVALNNLFLNLELPLDSIFIKFKEKALTNSLKIEDIFSFIFVISQTSTRLPSLLEFIFSDIYSGSNIEPDIYAKKIILEKGQTIETNKLGSFNYRKDTDKLDTLFNKFTDLNKYPLNILEIDCPLNAYLFLDKVPVLIYRENNRIVLETGKVNMETSDYKNRIDIFLGFLQYHYGYENIYIKKTSINNPFKNAKMRRGYDYYRYFLIIIYLKEGNTYPDIINYVDDLLSSMDNNKLESVIKTFMSNIIDKFFSHYQDTIKNNIQDIVHSRQLFGLGEECKQHSECESGLCYRNRCISSDDTYSKGRAVESILKGRVGDSDLRIPDIQSGGFLGSMIDETAGYDVYDFIRDGAIPPDIEMKGIDVNKAMIIAAEQGHIELVKLMIRKGANRWNLGMCSAAKGGHIELVKFFIDKGAGIYNYGMVYAAEGGHMDIIQFFINKGADNWDLAMTGAIKGGHMDIIQFFIDKGAYDWNWGMAHAANGGYMDIVQFFIDKGADNWDDGMAGAAKGGHIELVKFFIDKGADDWNKGMINAAEGGHMDLVQFFIDKGADEWNYGMINADEGGHVHIVQFFRDKINGR